MNMSHGETVIQKPINEYAVYLKSLLPANIPDTYALEPMFKTYQVKKISETALLPSEIFCIYFVIV